jgi:arylsulfatase A-like enzyme
MRSQYAEADDPDPPTEAEVPCRALEHNEDPDLLLGITQSYAGQISLMDLCIGALVDALQEAGLEADTTLALVGTRGLALGEHGQVGPIDDHLHGELVHVPMIIRLPDRSNASDRSHELIQPPDLFPTWLDVLTQQVAPPRLAAADLMPLIRDEETRWRDRIGLVGTDGHCAVRTSAWYLTTGSPCRLFAKPDDRWEANDVADRHADLAEELKETLSDYESHLPSSVIDALEPLNDVLRNGLE